MRDLAAFQEAFAEALHAPGPIGRIARQPGFAIYNNTCARGAVDALRAAYPTIDALIGEEGFTQLALAFRESEPPHNPMLSEYGRNFASFIARQPWTDELPYLADVARLDWLWLETFVAADPSPAPRPDGSITRLALSPAARFAWLETPAMTIWQAHRRPGGFDRLEPEWRSERALFTRRGSQVHAEPIDRADHLLLVLAAAGAALTVAAAALESTHGADPSKLISRHLASGAITIH
jgi:hypothetical protein